MMKERIVYHTFNNIYFFCFQVYVSLYLPNSYTNNQGDSIHTIDIQTWFFRFFVENEIRGTMNPRVLLLQTVLVDWKLVKMHSEHFYDLAKSQCK